MTMMKKIRTVTGDIEASTLGWCQCHEHLFLSRGKSCEVNEALCMDDEAKSTEELVSFRRAGGSAYVDAQPVGAGRMADAMARASEQTGVKIIASTGFHKLCFYENDSFIFTESAEQLHDRFAREINEGMSLSDRQPDRIVSARAGIVKVAVDAGGMYGNPAYEKLFEAAISAAADCGVAVLAHFEKNEDAFPLVRLLERNGLPAERLLACHLDRMRSDIGYHRELAAQGVYLEYDTINRLRYHDNKTEIDLILKMLSAGCKERLLLSLDTTKKRLRAYGADMGLDYILTDFSAQMRSKGVTNEDIETMMVNNPVRALLMQ